LNIPLFIVTIKYKASMCQVLLNYNLKYQFSKGIFIK
jgi:hypothetical protein